MDSQLLPQKHHPIWISRRQFSGPLWVGKNSCLSTREIFWSTLRRDVDCFIRQCHVCKLVKAQGSNTRLYIPLRVPTVLWLDVNLDFVLGLPLTRRQKDSIMVVIILFSKIAHFVACAKTFDATCIADLYFQEIVRLHEVPKTITSDCDVKFLTHLWKTLWGKLGIKLQFSSAGHTRLTDKPKWLNEAWATYYDVSWGKTFDNGTWHLPKLSLHLIDPEIRRQERVPLKSYMDSTLLCPWNWYPNYLVPLLVLMVNNKVSKSNDFINKSRKRSLNRILNTRIMSTSKLKPHANDHFFTSQKKLTKMHISLIYRVIPTSL